MQAQWSLQQWLEYLENIHHRPIDMGLSRVQTVAEKLQLLTPAATVLTVAGTNGKGSTVRYLEQILLAAGYSVACYTSPHIHRYEERVRYNGAELNAAQHAQAFQAIEQARGEISLTYFEFGTLAAIWLCQQLQPQVIVLEVGLGGRLDAVNVIEPDVAIVTSVGIDHIEFLGDNREDIGFEKAGIFRTAKPAICGEPEPPQRLLQHAKSIGAQLSCVNQDFSAERRALEFDFMGPINTWKNLPIPSLPFVNAITALAALQLSGLAITREHVIEGLQVATLTGRMQQVASAPTVILDVAHNPQAASYLAHELAIRFPQQPIYAVCGMLRDKDHQATLAALQSLVKHWYLASLPGERGANAEQLAGALPAASECTLFTTPAEAFTQATADASKDSVIVCFGSFLTVAAVQDVVTAG